MSSLEFVEETHTYLYDGVIIPSVSEIIRFAFPDAYKGIPADKLKAKADYGTKVHQLVEEFASGKISMDEIKSKKIDPNIKIAVEQFELLRKKWVFYIKSMEQMVCYKGKYAGTYDIKTEDNLIIDLKTTSSIHEDWLALQLGLYYLACGIRQELGYCIWLPKQKCAQVKEIKVKTWEECLEILKSYEQAHKSNEHKPFN